MAWQCVRCKELLPDSSFCPSTLVGKPGRRWCKGCRNAYYRARRGENEKGYFYQFTTKRRDKVATWMAQYKTTHGCVQCGERHPAALDFHHRDHTTKSHNIAALVAKGARESVIREEMAKCDLLCSNCHRKAHHADGNVAFRRPDVIERQRRNSALAAYLGPRRAARGIHRKVLSPWENHILGRFARAG